MQDVSKPYVQLRLGVRNPDTDSVEHVAFTLTVDKFKVLLHGAWYFASVFTQHVAMTGIGYPKENLKIHTGVPSLPSFPYPPSTSYHPPAFPSFSPSPPFLYPLPLETRAP